MASRAWPVLTRTAQRRAKIGYKELGDEIGIHHRTVRLPLELIQDYCLEEKLPPITILIVNQNRNAPGAGFIAWDVDDLETGFGKVWDYPWRDRGNPFSFASGGMTPS